MLYFFYTHLKFFFSLETLPLFLSAQFLKRLASVFGDQVEEVEACTIDVDHSLATAIYNAWKLSQAQAQVRFLT